MNEAKRRKLEEAGWTIGSASEFLELTEAESTVVEIKLSLAKMLREERTAQHVTQDELARRIGSSQSRIAKLESADRSVSIDLLVKTLAYLGTSQREIAEGILLHSGSKSTRPGETASAGEALIN